MIFAEVMLLIILISGIVGVPLIVIKRNSSQKKLLSAVPPTALTEGSSVYETRLSRSYKLNQRSVRVLEHLRNDYTISAMLSPEDKQQIDKIINEFYEKGI